MSASRSLWLLALAIPALVPGRPDTCPCQRRLMGAAPAAAPADAPWQLPWLVGTRAPLARPDMKLLSAYPVSRPRTYTGDHLEYVMMPIGGIGTGSIWLDGQGRLAVWQIFNNYSENRVPDSFFAIRAQVGGDKPVVRVLQTTPEAGFAPMQSLEYEGGYPIARLAFTDPELPVSVRLQALNPMIPTDAADSSLPCAIFRVSARNFGKAPVKVDVLGSLQNAVGSNGGAGINGVRFAGYGGNRNQLVREKGMTALFMHRGLQTLAPGLLRVRAASGAQVPGPELLWVDHLGGPAETAAAGAQATQLVQTMARLSQDGGAILATGVTPEFFRSVAAVHEKMGRWQDLEVFEDFEKGSYDGWTVKGEAFGKKPAGGTLAGQQVVSGFFGRGLVNTFLGGDGPQGEMTSKEFTIRKRYIGFLVGGGHWKETCMNLRVGGKVVRTVSGKDNERLEAAAWDVADLKGKQATLEIVDHASGGWGHINIDHIVFSDVPPDNLMRLDGAVEAIATQLNLPFESATAATAAGGVTATDPSLAADGWPVGNYVRLAGFKAGDGGFQVLAKAGQDPLVLAGSLGKARLVLCLAEAPASRVPALLGAALGRKLDAGERIVTAEPAFGSMCLSSPDASVTATSWTDGDALGAAFARSGALAGDAEPAPSPAGQTVNGALSAPLMVPPGEERAATFVVSWHFPNMDRFGHPGNLYNRRFADALGVARAVNGNLTPLWERTQLYHDTLYQSNLPEEWLDAISSQSVIFRGPTSFWCEDGYFAGYEGCYGCCPLNCTHVWNYAQSHARLFPEVGRNMRESDLLVYLHENGETSHRQHSPSGGFIDGHCATIEGTYREYLLSPDGRFLERVWPSVKKAEEWLIERIDADHDGVPAGRQPNTYDCDVSGANTFIGSQYLSALAAGEKMALAMKEPETAARWRAIREAGMKNQDAKLWNGEYYIQIPDPQPANDYDTGCHSDQLLGQWWAHQLDLGYLYPKEHIRSAMQSVMKNNFREKFAGFKQAPRRYIPDDEGGLLICTWPNGGRPNPFTTYADEVWTGIEYATAGEMIYEGMIDDARRIVKMARSRYDGRRRDGLNSGPGGNPFNELECGKFYARAMSSWGLLIAAQGQILDGPAGVIGFKPNWQPEDHRSFYTAPEGWGLFVQKRAGARQSEHLDVRHGRLKVRELVFAVPEGTPAAAKVSIAGKAVKCAVERNGDEVRIRLAAPATVTEGQAVEVRLGQ